MQHPAEAYFTQLRTLFNVGTPETSGYPAFGSSPQVLNYLESHYPHPGMRPHPRGPRGTAIVRSRVWDAGSYPGDMSGRDAEVVGGEHELVA